MFRYIKYYNDNYSIDDLHTMREIEAELQHNQKIMSFYENVFGKMNFKSVVKEWLFDGFETIEDYEKCGDLFKKVDK